MLKRKISIGLLFLTLFFALLTVNASAIDKTEEDFSGMLKVTVNFSDVKEQELIFPAPSSPLKVPKYYRSIFKLSSSNFFTVIEMVKKAIHEATQSYKSYIPIPVKDNNGAIIGFYAEKEAQTYELPPKYTRVIINNGMDIEGLKEGVIDNCKVLFRHWILGLTMQDGNTVGTVNLSFDLAAMESNKCEVQIKKEGERIASAFKESLKKLISDTVAQKPSTEPQAKTSDASKTSGSSLSGHIAGGLSLSCTAGNALACPPAMALDIVGFFTNFGKKSKMEEAIKIKNKEEQDIRDKCIEIMKDQSSAVISLENNMRLECIKEYGLVKARFFKDGLLIRQVIRMKEGQQN